MSRYLVGNSVLQRLPRSAAVQAAIGSLLDAEQELCCCALSLDEFAYSARSAAEHTEASRRLRTSFLYLPLSRVFLDVRAALWNAGTGRAAGVIVVALAATAVHFAAAMLQLRQRLRPHRRRLSTTGRRLGSPPADRSTEALIKDHRCTHVGAPNRCNGSQPSVSGDSTSLT